jgi:phosphotransferase system  glucose/maltose/N-acetylglucosamine-specific IIC component
MLKKKFVNKGTCGIIDKPFKNFLRKIGNIFIPMIPAFVGAGLIAGKYDFAN